MQTESKLLDFTHIKDESFNAESVFRYLFYLVISEHEMVSVVYDEQLRKMISFKSIKQQDFSFLEANYNDLKNYTQITDELNLSFKAKSVIITDDSCIFVPSEFSNAVEADAYYKLSREVKANSQVLNNSIDFQEIKSTFNISNEMLKFIRFNAPTADIFHHSLLFAKACFKNAEPNHQVLHVNINHSSFDVVQFSKNKLNFFNSFQFENDTDIVYYTLAVAQQQEIIDNLEIVLYGQINAEAALIKTLKNYCKDVKIIHDSGSNLPTELKKLPFQNYFIPFNALLCE